MLQLQYLGLGLLIVWSDSEYIVEYFFFLFIKVQDLFFLNGVLGKICLYVVFKIRKDMVKDVIVNRIKMLFFKVIIVKIFFLKEL